MKRAGAAVFWLVFLAAAVAPAAPESPFSEFEALRRAAAERMEKSVVWVVVEDDRKIASGSGFLVAEGYILTNAHVVEGFGRGRKIHILNERLPLRPAELIAQAHEDRGPGGSGDDFALLRFSPPPGADLPILSFNLDLKRMDRVEAWGYPGMVARFDESYGAFGEGADSLDKPAPLVYTEGAVNAIVRQDRRRAIIHSAAIAGGNSGGPLVNSRGEVVGVNTWGYKEDDEGAFLNAALPAEAAAAFLRAQGLTPRLAPGQVLPETRPEAERPAAARPEAEKPGKLRPPAAEDRRPEGGDASRQSPGSPPDTPSKFKPAAPPETGPEPADDDRRRDVGRLSLTVPEGWSVLDSEQDSILLGEDGGRAAIGLVLNEDEGLSLKEAAEACARELGGATPARDRDTGFYFFAYQDDDEATEVKVVVGENAPGEHFMLFIVGDEDSPGVDEVLDSLEDRG